MWKLVLGGLAALLLGTSSAQAAGTCPGQSDYVNNRQVAPQRPRDKQLARFVEWMRKYGSSNATPFHGTALVVGESPAAMYPMSSLKADFGVAAEDVANVAVDGATIEEVWWMIDVLPTGFEWITSDGKDKGWVAGVDLSRVDKVLIPNFGGNSLKRAADSGPYLVALQAAHMIRDLRTKLPRSARILVTEKIEPGDIADTCYAGQEVYFNADLKAMSADERSFAWRATPRWNILPSGDVTQAHCGYNHRDPVLFQPNGVHFLPVYYQTFLDPVVYAYFHNVARTTPGADTDGGRCVPRAADPKGPLPADPKAAGPNGATPAGSYQGPF